MPSRLLFLICGVLLSTLAGCQEANEYKPPPPPTVTVKRPVEREVPEMIRVSGQTRATAMVDIRARVDGYLMKIHFQDGADVKEGDLLFEIDPAPYQVVLDAANAQLLKVQAAQRLAEANLARTRQLQTQNATTQQQVDVEEAQFTATAAEIATAQAAVAQAELNLSYTKVKSPIAGRMNRHLVDIGGLVQAETTSLGIVESVDPIHVYFYLSEAQQLHLMKLRQTDELPDPRKSPPTIELAIGNDTEYRWKGHIDYGDFGIDPGTGTTLQRALFPNENHTLVPGMFVRLQRQVGESKERLLIEEAAVGADQRGDYLLVVNDQNIVEYRPVQLGEIYQGLRVVLEGLQPNERVVVKGLQRARPTFEVVPMEENEAGQPKNGGGDAAPLARATGDRSGASSKSGGE